MVDDDNFSDVISREEAGRILQRSGVLWLAMCGHLETKPLPNGLRGVTMASVQRELEWQRAATRSQRIRRSLGNLLQWFSI
jgi:hypothetical protein